MPLIHVACGRVPGLTCACVRRASCSMAQVANLNIGGSTAFLAGPSPSQPSCLPLDPSQAVVCYLGPPSHLFWNILPMSLWVLAVTLGTILFGERGGRAEASGLHLPSTACALPCMP